MVADGMAVGIDGEVVSRVGEAAWQAAITVMGMVSISTVNLFFKDFRIFLREKTGNILWLSPPSFIGVIFLAVILDRSMNI